MLDILSGHVQAVLHGSGNGNVSLYLTVIFSSYPPCTRRPDTFIFQPLVEDTREVFTLLLLRPVLRRLTVLSRRL